MPRSYLKPRTEFKRERRLKRETRLEKKILLIIMVLLTIILLSGCSTMEKEQPSTFMICEEYPSGDVLVDRNTGVMYWISTSAYNYGTLTLLVNADGSPKIWNDN